MQIKQILDYNVTKLEETRCIFICIFTPSPSIKVVYAAASSLEQYNFHKKNTSRMESIHMCFESLIVK